MMHAEEMFYETGGFVVIMRRRFEEFIRIICSLFDR